MAYFKLTILVIKTFIGFTHVSCLTFPPPGPGIGFPPGPGIGFPPGLGTGFPPGPGTGFPPGPGIGFPPGFLQPPGIGQQFGTFFPAETDFDTDDSEVLLVQDNGIIDNGVGVGNGGGGGLGAGLGAGLSSLLGLLLLPFIFNRLNSGPAPAPVQPVIIVQPATAGATAAATTVAAMTTVAVTTTMATTTEVKEP
ncbi:uncharacterized protein LOC143050999 [Mytilus galloprovincialis]|uniref:uncharacterized protein LOC143050999 n=1 Tax=Mytilus galloprovincialis TaxID=29158 RepID=UPI003F7CC686